MQREKAEKLDTVDHVRPISVVNEMRFMYLLVITVADAASCTAT